MKKNYLFIGAAAIMMAGCASDDIVGDENISSGETPIAFSMNTPAMTRNGSATTEHAKLNDMFYVWGEKNEHNSATTITDNVTAANTVFQNYTVKYGENTANTTTSNTQNWEYVGLGNDAVSNANLYPQTPTPQTIKYWDAEATDYTFTAISAKSTDITSNKVIIKKKIKADTGKNALDKGYEITITDMDAAAEVYVSDRVNIAKTDLAVNNPLNAYGGYVKFTFRNFQSKVRFGIYEKVPGYKVVITEIKGKYYDTSTSSVKDAEYTSTNKNFGVTGKFVVVDASTKYNVTYEGTTAYTAGQKTENRAKVTVDSNSKTVEYLNTSGQNWLNTKYKVQGETDNPVGEEATSPTWDKGNQTNGSDSWTAILPSPDNTDDMTLQISYTLISEDTGEKIQINDKTVKVPSEYCQWKPNFAYTYLFKITDQSADLYPITFDACVITDETGQQETITTVTDPAWTTFATTADGTSYKTGSNEYVKDDIIYATLSNSGSIADLVVDASNDDNTTVKLYTVATSDVTNFPITEASVANALATTSAGTKKLTVTPITINTDGTTLPLLTTKVPTEDGNTITITNGKVLKWQAADNTVYAVEYINSGKKTYKIVRINEAETTTTNP